MNKSYWLSYYEKEKPSEFAKFCLKYIPQGSQIADIGCGTGRDTFLLSQKGFATGFDYAFKPRGTFDCNFVQLELKEIIKKYQTFDVIYSRFFIHSISNKEIIKFIKWVKGLFMAEFRDANDVPLLYKDHQRNKISGEWLQELLLKNYFDILYYGKSRGWAKYKNEDPLVVRIIAKKNVSI